MVERTLTLLGLHARAPPRLAVLVKGLASRKISPVVQASGRVQRRSCITLPAMARMSPRHAAELVEKRDRLLQLFSNEKSFGHRWIGSPTGNRLGLHVGRVRLAEICAGMRRRLQTTVDSALESRLRQDGLLVIEDVIPPMLFEEARDEFRRALHAQALRVPIPPGQAQGFGPRLPNAWGFDRYDGGSLNRFIRIDDNCAALRQVLSSGGPLVALLRSLCGTSVALEHFLIYLLVHGPEATRPDLQRQIHCDTFHETYKLWYFFDEVGLAQGPLMFSPGSHLNMSARLRWEQRCVVEGHAESASFRIQQAALAELGWKAPQPVLTRPNSLVLANTRGFHCRSTAAAGTQRPCVYANLRPRAFSPFA